MSNPNRPLDAPEAKKRMITRPGFTKRTHSVSPTGNAGFGRGPVIAKKPVERRCQSLSPSACPLRNFKNNRELVRSSTASAPEAALTPQHYANSVYSSSSKVESESVDISETGPVIPHTVKIKTMRLIATKKREFMKAQKSLITTQNTLIENYAELKELEARIGSKSIEEDLGEVRLLSVKSWAAHDLLLLLRDKPAPKDGDGSVIGAHVLNQLHSHLNPIPEDIQKMAAELMARRIDLLNLLHGKFKVDRQCIGNLEWKTKYTEFNAETEKLHRMVADTAENLKAKLNHSLSLAKIAWLDRDTLIKKIERLQKEALVLQNKIEENATTKSETKQAPLQSDEQALTDELLKERAAREALKDAVSSAEGMLRAARARITTLEGQLKETRADLDATRKKQKDLEQLCRNRETSYDARYRKLLEASKIGEGAVESLSRQRSALELRVKELREQAEVKEKTAKTREQDLQARIEAFTSKMSDQEKLKKTAETRAAELETKVKELEERQQTLRERSVALADIEKRRCFEYVLAKEREPSDRETEIFKEMQATRMALAKAEDEVRQAAVEREHFLNSLNRIAQENPENYKNKMATELLEKEQKIIRLQHAIDEHKKTEKIMEENIVRYKTQLAELRLEVKSLRHYDCYVKEESFQDLQTELIELQLQVVTLSREREALMTAAASRALMLERHERAADLFAKTTSVRRDLAAIVNGSSEPPTLDADTHSEVHRSLSCVCAKAADTWTALRAERARVLHLEGAVLTQQVQLERESRVRTQLEYRRAMLEREVLKIQHTSPKTSIATCPITSSFRIQKLLGINDDYE